ncbi:14105_t:CDS:2, partial [Gigaspora margarita]
IYAETIRIARKAINIAIEMNDQNVLRFLKEYIAKKGHSLVENTISASHFGQETNMLKKYSKFNIIEISSIKVSNPIKKVRRGQPPKTACYQSSLEKQPPRNKGKQPKLTRGPRTNTCSECSGKELHDYDFIEINDENEWVEFSDLESDDEMDL